MPPELVVFTVVAAIVAVAAVVVALVAHLHQRGTRPDPATWVHEPLEPWGTIVVLCLIVTPGVLALAHAMDMWVLTPVVFLLIGAFVYERADQIGGVRKVTIDAEGVHWQTLRRSGTVLLREVTEVVGYQRSGGLPRLLLADGTVVTLDRQPHARVVAALVDQQAISCR